MSATFWPADKPLAEIAWVALLYFWSVCAMCDFHLLSMESHTPRYLYTSLGGRFLTCSSLLVHPLMNPRWSSSRGLLEVSANLATLTCIPCA